MERLDLSEVIDLPFLLKSKDPKKNATFRKSLLRKIIVLSVLSAVLAPYAYPILLQIQGVIGNYLNESFQWLYHDVFNENKDFCFVLTTAVNGTIFFFLMTAIPTYHDFQGTNSSLYKYKIQEKKHPNEDMKKFWHTIKLVLFNMYIITPIVLVASIPLMRRRLSFGHLPPLSTILFQIFLGFFLQEALFYYGHRFLHYGILYRRIHKVHHEWTAPFAIACIYAHPIEYAINNIFFVMLVPFILGSHVTFLWLWEAIILAHTINSHCGYHLPLFLSPEAHDFHHVSFTSCYGMIGLLDGIHQTDSAFKKHVAYKRAVTYFSTEPIKKQIPN